MENKSISQRITVFHGRTAPEEGELVGYGALIDYYLLAMPIPNKLSLISLKTRQYNHSEWRVFTPRHMPDDSLYKHIIFALRYEGINLLFFKKLFEKLEVSAIEELVQIEPMGQYSRKIWFLFEWLMGIKLEIPSLNKGNYVELIDTTLQYAIKGVSSSRHRVVNNLPGVVGFCPLVFKTEKLENYLASQLSEKKINYLKEIRKDVLQRASAFLLLKDSKASFTIEGENPPNIRAVRWGKAIGQAGAKELSKKEFLRLQQTVIENSRFTKMGYRDEGGFVGEHDRDSGEPLPEHISAKWQDVESLVDGLIEVTNVLEHSDFDAVIAASNIAFGFIFIHPFADGNGRIHRYLIHHILAKMQFAQQGVIFPVSASILNHIDDYRRVLEDVSHPILDFIEWKPTTNHNIEVTNETADYYRYYDGTQQAEFLYDCVNDTIENIIPNEVNYLQKFDEMKRYLENKFEMPDKMIALLIRFLEQNDGSLSQRSRKKDFEALSDIEISEIEQTFSGIFIE